MVCSFFYRTIPVLVVMLIYWAYCRITGKDQEPDTEPEIEQEEKGKEEVMLTNCPYHIFMAAIGFPVWPKKKVDAEPQVASESTSDEGTEPMKAKAS